MSDSASDSDYSDSSSPGSESTRTKKKRQKKEKKAKKKEKRVRKKEKKKAKKENKKTKKKERRGRSSNSSSSSRSRSRSKNGRRQGRDRSRSRGRAPPPPPLGMPPPPMMMAGVVPQNVREACEMAGRGVTTGQTTKDIDVTVYDPTGDKIKPERFESFDEIKEFPREIRDELRKAGFPGPSQIQAYTWPLGIRSKDVIGIAATGSGKTLAFLLPAFAEMHDVGHRPEREGTGLVVMSPTRELAQQTESEASRFGRCLGMRCVAMYGGTPKGEQMSKYRAGCHSIVACPGRLNDFLDGGQVKLNGVKSLVLDEADRMLDMGFEPQIRKILARMPKKRHTMFFTATWPVEVRQLASEILHKPYRVMIGNRDELKGNYDVIQQVQMVESFSKNERLVQLLRYAGLSEPYSCGKALVFSNTKRMCSTLENYLARAGFPCSSIHGDKDQMQRDAALGGLKDGRIKVLVATDVAARGLDIKGVGLVVNFDPANNAEDYVHRIGRTGRAGARGYAITFLTSADAGKARGIMEVMERTSQLVPPELHQLAGLAREGRNRGRGGDGKGGGKGGGRGGDRSPSRARVARSPRSPSRARVARSPSL